MQDIVNQIKMTIKYKVPYFVSSSTIDKLLAQHKASENPDLICLTAGYLYQSLMTEAQMYRERSYTDKYKYDTANRIMHDKLKKLIRKLALNLNKMCIHFDSWTFGGRFKIIS